MALIAGVIGIVVVAAVVVIAAVTAITAGVKDSLKDEQEADCHLFRWVGNCGI